MELSKSITRNWEIVESIAPKRIFCSSAVVFKTHSALCANGEFM